MLLSLRATWVHIRQMAYQGLDALRRSPLTPPVTIIIPAWNEQDVIVNSVRSALQVGLP
jgi:cellulose synthase/poly-beta-1,6-N-acetylglucosamine synthase-like glycosyltransferase